MSAPQKPMLSNRAFEDSPSLSRKKIPLYEDETDGHLADIPTRIPNYSPGTQCRYDEKWPRRQRCRSGTNADVSK